MKQDVSDQGPFGELFGNISLLRRITARDIRARYQGSVFGALWSIGTPLLLMLAYWFVLGVVLQARWGAVPSKLYPIMLFAGLVVHLFGAEVLGRSPSLIIDNRTYVKKVVFPLTVLPWMLVATSIFHLIINLSILLIGQLLIAGSVPITWPLVLVVLLPLLPLLLGLSWFISSLSVFLRDVQQVVPLLLTLMMFFSPIFFPIEAIPSEYRILMYLNPMTLIIGQVREVTIAGNMPDFSALGLYAVGSLIVMYAGHWWFNRTRRGFADVL